VLRYRNVIYAGTVLTGLTGLIYQVVWQEYLSFLVGSEARSVALVDQAQQSLSALAERGLIGPDYQQGMMNQLRAGQQARDQFISGLSGG